MIPTKYINLSLQFYPQLTKFKCSYFKEYLVAKKKFSTIKYGIQLIPDIKKDLHSGEMKHRKHPGIRRMAPIKLPSFVRDAIYRLISNENESSLLKEARQLCKKIYCRRLPLEMHEVKEKIYETSSHLEDNSEYMPEIFKKEQILELKKHLQMEIGRWKPFEYDQHECLVYLAGRAATNYASTFRVFTEIKNRDPTFQPKTFFDFGSGIGSATWAANSLWSSNIKEYFCVDSSSEMNDLSQSIISDETTEEMLLKPVNYRQFLPASEHIKYDLVVSAFSLMDLSSAKDRLQVIDTLWRKTADILVVIEYGNLAGFSTVLDARDYILHIENGSSDQTANHSNGAHILCPCPHDSSCPMVKMSKDPCGLAVSYETIFPRQAFQNKKDWISYIVLRKGPRSQNDTKWPRLIKPVLKKSKHVYCNLCCKDGEIHQVIVTKAKHGRHEYRSARSSSLGDLLPVNVSAKNNDVDILDPSFSESDDSDINDEQNKT